MILCPKCQASDFDPGIACRACGFMPETIDGFLAWAPELARNNSGFHPRHFSELAQVEESNFWFRSRNMLIIWALKKYFPALQSLLEVGCGTGYVLSGVSNSFPKIRLVGSEIFVTGLPFAAQRVPTAELVQMDARRLPYREEFDVIGAFDVIEHVEEDESVLQEIHRALKPGGGCLISVPQHMWLWSPVDDEACHKRRYSAAELHRKMNEAGFHVLLSTSFVTLLLPVMALSRMVDRYLEKSGGPESLRMNRFINYLFERILYFERLFIMAGLRWPIGGSRLVVAKKKC